VEGLGEVTSAALDEQYAPSGTRSPGAEPSASETSIPVAESTEAAAASPSVEAAGWRNRWAGVLRYAAVALLAAGAGWGFSGSWRPVQTSAQDMRLAQTVSGAAMMDLKRQEVPDLESTVLGALQPDSSDGLQDLPGATDGFDSRSLKESAVREISIPPVALRETPAAARAGRSEPLIAAAMPETRIEETTPQERQPVGRRVSTANEATPEYAEDTQSVDQVAASDERVDERGNRSPGIDLPEVWVDQLVEAGPGVVAPQLIRRPRVRLAGGENTEVRTRVLVDYRGSVIDVVVLDADRVSQGNRSRVEAAARRVKFRSATKNDVPVRMWAELTF